MRKLTAVSLFDERISAPGNMSFELIPKRDTLKNVEVFSSKFDKHKSLNEFRNCSSNWLDNDGSVKQIAQEFLAPENCKLLNVNICKGEGIFNSGGKAFYRIRLYGFNEITEEPDDDLFNEAIEVKSSSNIDVINLKGRNIMIPKGKFYIAIEWIIIEENKVIPTSKDINGKKYHWIYYRPAIGLEKTNEGLRIWQLSLDNKWSHGALELRRMRIAAKVMY